MYTCTLYTAHVVYISQ